MTTRDHLINHPINMDSHYHFIRTERGTLILCHLGRGSIDPDINTSQGSGRESPSPSSTHPAQARQDTRDMKLINFVSHPETHIHTLTHAHKRQKSNLLLMNRMSSLLKPFRNYKNPASRSLNTININETQVRLKRRGRGVRKISFHLNKVGRLISHWVRISSPHTFFRWNEMTTNGTKGI